MGKIRTVKPELFRHLGLFEEERQHGMLLRLAFIGLFTCCDREGRFKWEPRSLKLDILPYDDVDFEQILNVLWGAGFIKKYVWQNKYYGFIPSWHQHQCINKREPASKLPDPEKCTPESFPTPVHTELQIGAKKEKPKRVQTPVTHIPISDLHVHTPALHGSTPTFPDVEKHTNQLESVVPNTSLHVHASAEHMPTSATSTSHSATHESVPALVSGTAHPIVGSAIQPAESIKPVLAPIPPAVKSAYSFKKSNTHITQSEMHVHARALHSTVHEMHMHASLEVEMEEEVEREREMEVEQERELEKSLGANRNIVAPVRHRSITLAQISTVFNHWKMTLQHPHAVLDKKRHELIKQALQQGYTVADLCDAINGCAQTPHNMGDNDRGQRYDGLHIIFGGSDQIERFISNYHNPPRPPNPANKLLQANIAAGKSWLQRKKNGD